VLLIEFSEKVKAKRISSFPRLFHWQANHWLQNHFYCTVSKDFRDLGAVRKLAFRPEIRFRAQILPCLAEIACGEVDAALKYFFQI